MRRAVYLLGLMFGITMPAGAAPAGGPNGSTTAPRDAIRPGTTISVITECTEAGGRIPVPTAEHPVYVITHSGGRHDYGRPVAGGETLADATVQTDLAAAATAGNYLTARGHRPSLVLFVNWGIHANPEYAESDPGYHNILDRAVLVGGQKFAHELAVVLERTDMAAESTPKQAWGFQQPGMNPVTPAVLWQGLSPLETFRNRSPLNARLLDQIGQDCYYVIVSAFDYDALSRGTNLLLWRTKLTVPSQGAALATAVPALIRIGGGYYGRDMPGPKLIAMGAK